MLFLLSRTLPAANDDGKLRKTDPQPLADIARLGKTAGWYQPNTDEGWRGLLYQREHFGSQEGGLADLDRKPQRIKCVL